MKMKSKVMLVGIEAYESKKSGQQYAKCLFSDGGAEAVTILSKDLKIFEVPVFSALNAVFDYNPQYNSLSLSAFELCKQ